MKRANTGLTKSVRKLDDTDQFPDKAMSTRNVNNIVLSDDKLENEDWLSKDPGNLLPMETTFKNYVLYQGWKYD